jgi:hypothetical protein
VSVSASAGLRRRSPSAQKNGERLTLSLGDDFNLWVGRQIVLVANEARATNPMEPAVLAYADGEFLAERRVPTLVESQIAAQKPLDQGDDPLDDEVPF